MGEWKNLWMNLMVGPSEKDTYIRELLRHIDALKAELADIKKGEWVARVFDAEAHHERLRLTNKIIINEGYSLADFIQHNMACSCTNNNLCKKCSTLNTWETAVHTWR